MQEKDAKKGNGNPFGDDEKDIDAGKISGQDAPKKKRRRRPRNKKTAEDRKKEVLSDSDLNSDDLSKQKPAGLIPDLPVEGAADFPAFDSVHTNVPDENLEHRYSEEPSAVKKEEKAEVKEEPVSPFESADVPREPSAPTTPGKSSPLENKAFEDKPLDNIGDTSAMPFQAPEVTEDEKEKMVEDNETDEQRDTQADDNMIDGNTSKTSPLEEGAVQEYEQNDPLTSHPAESPVEELPDDDMAPGAQVEVADVTDLNDDGGSAIPADDAGFWDMLEDAGIQKKHVFMVAGVFGLILAVVLFFVFGGYKLFSGGGDQPEQTEQFARPNVKVEQKADESTDEPTEQVPTSYDQEFGLSGLVNSYIFGLEFSKYKVLPGLNLNPVSSGGSTVGVDAALSVGQPQEVSRDLIVYYVGLLRQIDNVRRVEIYNYLNQFVDRRAALQDHLATLNGLLLQADEAKNMILQELNRIDVEYDATGDEKDTYEVTFFDAMNGFNGEKAHDYLELFVGASQQRVKMKAYFNALGTLNEMFDASIASLGPRIQDISLNSEALIKGVQVFEVTGSSIDAIILQQN